MHPLSNPDLITGDTPLHTQQHTVTSRLARRGKRGLRDTHFKAAGVSLSHAGLRVLVEGPPSHGRGSKLFLLILEGWVACTDYKGET